MSASTTITTSEDSGSRKREPHFHANHHHRRSDAMTSVYNLLREACGISQAEAAEHVHGTRLDTVKSWSSDRRPAPGWAINHLQSLHRRIHAAGTDYAEILKRTFTEGNAFVLRIANSDDDARWHGFPSLNAQRIALAVAISLLPDDAEISIVDRGILPMLKLPPEVVTPTATDRNILAEMKFVDGRCYTAGAMNRRKFERLEKIGWIEGKSLNPSDVEYRLTRAGGYELALVRRGRMMLAHPPSIGFQSQVRAGPGPLPPVFLSVGEQVVLDREHVFTVTKIEGEVVTARLSDGSDMLLSAPPNMFR
ncbi:hypothetical protein ABH973_006680 [Bradyrhizobium ottawaense]|uniref:hypothetical protein n=1 Tax=Bradyrhizobium ottawaense TaxID=931866 RepID=UPI0035154EB0